MLPGPLSAQATVPLALTRVAVKSTGAPPAMSVELAGKTVSEASFPPPPPVLFPDPPPHAMNRQSSDTDPSPRTTDMGSLS